MTNDNSRKSWLGVAATVLSVVACYGTLAMVGILGMLGVAITFNETIWAGAIVGLAGLAVIGFGFGYFRHRSLLPMMLALCGLAAIVYVMFVEYSVVVELMGFVLLCFAAYLDWRAYGKK